MRRVRVKAACAVLLLGCLAGCGRGGSPRCPQAADLPSLCAAINAVGISTCPRSWQAVQTNHSYCAACAMGTWSVGSCGGYNVLFHDRADGPSLYFDQTSGKLVGAAEVPQVTPSTWCRSAPGVAFDPPDCGSSFTAQLPGWCSPSGDADAGSRAFPCCETTADRCPGSAFLCPTVWRDSRVALSQFCQPLVSGANPQAGACGGYDVIRYLSGTTERTLYYDATGALVAEIAADSLCEYGPVNGIELPICSSSLPAICPDGGVDGGADGP